MTAATTPVFLISLCSWGGCAPPTPRPEPSIVTTSPSSSSSSPPLPSSSTSSSSSSSLPSPSLSPSSSSSSSSAAAALAASQLRAQMNGSFFFLLCESVGFPRRIALRVHLFLDVSATVLKKGPYQLATCRTLFILCCQACMVKQTGKISTATTTTYHPPKDPPPHPKKPLKVSTPKLPR